MYECDLKFKFDAFDMMIQFVLEMDKRRQLYKFERGLNLTCKLSALPNSAIPACDKHNDVVDETYALWNNGNGNPEQLAAYLAYTGEL